jgi:nucleoid-associated protein YgaU
MAIIVPILTQFDDKGIKSAVREFDRAKTSLGKFAAVGEGFKAVGTSLTRNVTLPLAVASAGIYKLVQAGSTLQESISKTNAVFGANAREVQDWSRTTSAAFGVSQQQALEAAGTYGNLFRAFGLGSKQAQDMSQNLVELAADMASFNNVPIDDALLALRSGLSGETEPLKKFGVALTDARLKEEALRLGLIKTTSGTLPIAIKSQAAYSLILKDTALQQGDVARTSEGFANQMKFLQAEVTNVKAQLGTALLPVVLKFVDVLREDVVPLVQRFADTMTNLNPKFIEIGLKIGLFVAAIGPLLYIFGTLIGSIKTFIEVFKILNLTFLLSPVGLVIAGLVALSIVVIRAWKTSDTFRQGIAKLGNAFIGFVEGAINYAIKGLNFFIQTINKIIRGLKFFGIDIEEIGEISEVAFGRLSFSAVEAKNSMGALAAQTDTLGMNVADQVVPAIDDMNQGLNESSSAMNKAKDAAKNAAQAIVDNLEDSLRKAESALEDIKGKFNDFKGAIGNTITGILDFGKAAESEDFLKGLADQATKATLFADKVKQLVVLGLNERAIRQVLDAGFDAGSKIADSIIIGGTTVVEQINTLVDSIFTVADQVGEFGAVAFYDAGVKQAEAMVAGIKATLEAARASLKGLMDGLTTGGDNTSGGTTSAGTGAKTYIVKPGDTLGKIAAANNLSLKAILDANAKFTSDPKYKGGSTIFSGTTVKIPRLADGGIVLGATNAIIGEAGPEAVIPLSGKNAGGLGNTFNITVNAGIGTNGAQVGRDIVEAIRKYERSSGQVFVRV